MHQTIMQYIFTALPGFCDIVIAIKIAIYALSKNFLIVAQIANVIYFFRKCCCFYRYN